MKSSRTHKKADLLLLGETDEELHKFMDAAHKYLGSGGRSVRHSEKTIHFVRRVKGDKAKRIALLHILLDNRILDRKYVEKRIKGKINSNEKLSEVFKRWLDIWGDAIDAEINESFLSRATEVMELKGEI